MIERGPSMASLPHALRDADELARRLDGRRPAVFLDYDGTLTPIVDRPEDAIISDAHARGRARAGAGAARSAWSAGATARSCRS